MPPVDHIKQAFIYLYSVGGGIIFGFLYDVLRISRRSIKHSKVIVAIQDITYWLIVSVGVLLLVYHINEGEVRAYIVVGILCGSVLYFIIFSRAILFITVPIVSFVIKVASIMFRVLIWPLKILRRILRKSR